MIIAFVIIAAAMLVAALAWVLVPLLRGARASGGIDREASNVAILRDQLKELDNDLASGTVSGEQYDAARRELEQRVLEESQAAPRAAGGPPSSAGAYTAAVVGGLLPIAAALLYFTLGSHQALVGGGATAAGGPGDAQHDLSPQKVAEMAASLAAKLEKEPNNVDGWLVLAHTYYSLKRFPEAAGAYEKVVALIPDDANILADYADALGAASNSLDGKPTELIQRALKADPTQWKALALAGTVAFNSKDYPQAVAYWEKLKATLPPDSDLAKSIDGSIAEARDLGGIKVAAAPAPATGAADPASAAAKPAPGAAKPTPSAALPGAGVSGTISLSPALAKTAAPEDTVFVVARAAEGPKMPLAILRKQVKDLPLKFALDDSLAMSPEMKLSNFAEVVVAARVSKSGNAMPQAGDLEGASQPVKVGASGIAVVIDKARP